LICYICEIDGIAGLDDQVVGRSIYGSLAQVDALIKSSTSIQPMVN